MCFADEAPLKAHGGIVYKVELAVATKQVYVSAGGVVTSDIASTEPVRYDWLPALLNPHLFPEATRLNLANR